MTKLQQSERDQAIAELRATLKPGDTVYTVLRHVSRSGMSRLIDCYVMPADCQKDGPQRITWSVGKAADIAYDRKAEALRVGGCGMDMGFHVVYNLSRSMFRDGFACIGQDCPANDHSNAYQENRQGKCAMCGKQLELKEPVDVQGNLPADWKYWRYNRHHKIGVCSQACAAGVWMHSDAGYALRQRWI